MFYYQSYTQCHRIYKRIETLVSAMNPQPWFSFLLELHSSIHRWRHLLPKLQICEASDPVKRNVVVLRFSQVHEKWSKTKTDKSQPCKTQGDCEAYKPHSQLESDFLSETHQNPTAKFIYIYVYLVLEFVPNKVNEYLSQSRGGDFHRKKRPCVIIVDKNFPLAKVNPKPESNRHWRTKWITWLNIYKK